MWKMLERKAVQDFDGFWTEYSLYSDGEKFVCVFGDHELYGPEDEGNWDIETECEQEAYDFFNNYNTEEYGINANCFDEDQEKYNDNVENNKAVEVWHYV